MNKFISGLKIGGFGVLLFIILVMVQVIISIATTSYDTVDTWWGGIIQAVVIGLIAWWFSRVLRATTARQALGHGLGFLITLLIISLLLVLPNTWQSVFGNWAIYFVFAGVFLGPLLGTKKPLTR